MFSSSAYSLEEKQHIFYIRDALEVIGASVRLAGNDKVFVMPCSWNLDDSKTMHGAGKERVHTTDILIFIAVFRM